MSSKDGLEFKTFVPRNTQKLCPASHRARRLKPHIVISSDHVTEENQNTGVHILGYEPEYKCKSGNLSRGIAVGGLFEYINII